MPCFDALSLPLPADERLMGAMPAIEIFASRKQLRCPCSSGLLLCQLCRVWKAIHIADFGHDFNSRGNVHTGHGG